MSAYANSSYLLHYGISGQKWGRRRFQNEDGSLTEAGKERYLVKDNYKKTYSDDNAENFKAIDARATKSGKGKSLSQLERIAMYDAAWDLVDNDKKISKYLDKYGKDLVKELNSRYDPQKNRKEYDKAAQRYMDAYNDMMYTAVEALYNQTLDLSDQKRMQHGYLIHYGISGQRKGVRRFQNEDGSLTEEGKRRYGYYDKSDGSKDYKRLKKDAERDAKEYARAQAYYGEGAGIRRKKIKNLTSERMKDEDYKEEFEKFLSRQDMSSHQKAANRERKVQDAKNFTGKTARGVKNIIMGVGNVSLSALAVYSLARATGADKVIANAAKIALKKVGLG